MRSADSRRARSVVAPLPLVARCQVFGDRLHATVADAEAGRREIQDALAAAGIQVDGTSRIQPQLEDVFLAKIAEVEAEAT